MEPSEAPLTGAQVGAAMGFVWVGVTWLVAEAHHAAGLGAGKDRAAAPPDKPRDTEAGAAAADPAPAAAPRGPSALLQLAVFHPRALAQHRETLSAWAQMGCVMCVFYLCDRTSLVGSSGKSYDRDLFCFLCLAVLAHGWASSMGASKHTGYLNRDQTEEWKGMMQVVFLLYHYFKASEAYNWIRVFIAAYVWMTGFGNFSYYYVRKDFSVSRFVQMMWRLNFFVALCCVCLNNSYMLYYICPMHTLFTLMLYFALRIRADLNETNVGVGVKVGACLALVAAVWEPEGMFDALWWPLLPLVRYVNPAKPGGDPMHEWRFRSGLDRYVWVFGMVVAYLHPWATARLAALDAAPPARRYALYAAIISAAAAVGWAWYAHVMTLDKFAYNAVHPFTSWVPIALYILLRNLHPAARRYHMEFFASCGRITLETYIGQFHVWLNSGAPDAQPGRLLSLVPGYPYLNFALASAVYILIAHRVFHLTNTLKNAHIPTKDDAQLWSNAVTGACLVAGLWLAGEVVVLMRAGVK